MMVSTATSSFTVLGRMAAHAQPAATAADGQATLSVRSVQGVQRGRALEVGHEHSRHRAQADHGSLPRDAGHGDHLYTTLKLAVTQTFGALAAEGPSDAQAAADGSVAVPDDAQTATLKARLKLSFNADGASTQIKLRIKAEGSAADLQGMLETFVGTLQAAVQTLFGTDRGQPAAMPLPAPAPMPTDGAVPAPLALPAVDAAAPADAISNGSMAAAAAESAPPAATALAPQTAAGGTARADISMRIRMTYQAAAPDMGAIVARLAQPGVGSQSPALSPVLGDLSTQFQQLAGLLPDGTGSSPTLQDFLGALATRLSLPAPSDSTGGGSAPAGLAFDLRVRGGLLSTSA